MFAPVVDSDRQFRFCLRYFELSAFPVFFKKNIFFRMEMCRHATVGARCPPEKGLCDTWRPVAAPGLRAPVELWRSSQTPAVPGPPFFTDSL